VIVALTIPLALLFAFIFLHAEGIGANLLSIGAIDFGILIDGTLVMVENIFRELGAREGQSTTCRSDQERGEGCGPAHFLFGRVIIAGYLPIYALTGPSGKLFKPMADTVAIALVGALI
jgi:cobalt-zinc-cadmium resistance protein CzcA